MSETTQTSPPYQDHQLPIPVRVQDLISRLSLEEKISQLVNDAPGIRRLALPAYDWWNECLHGVGRAGIATVFPQAIGMAASWDVALMKRIAEAISDEGRAKHHAALRKGEHGRYTGLTFFSPNINIFRDPRWGRGQETYGEDPYLTARLGVAFVTGLQGDHPQYLKTVATPKHFAVHSGPEALRHHFNAEPSPYDLHATFLPAFKACVQEGKAVSIMGAYNRVHGEACCASSELLEKILRQEWGFGGEDGTQGYVVSDCGAVADIFMHHKLTDSMAAAAVLALSRGCDLNCGMAYESLRQAYEQGMIEEDVIDQALARLFTTRFRLGMFDPEPMVPFARIPEQVIDSPSHRALALQAARESLVLLKNDGILPIPPSVQSIAVIGPHAMDVNVLLGNYHGTPSHPVSILEGIRNQVQPDVRVGYAQGCALTGGDMSGFHEAIRLAQRSGVAIVCLGLSQLLEGEEGQTEGVPGRFTSQGDRQHLNLPGVQESLLRAIADTGTPTILVLLGGSAIAATWAQDHLPAILLAWYPGQAGGHAVGEALFGAYNPAGRLPVTFYRSITHIPPFDDYSMAGRTYRYFHGTPLYPFGFGLSYTRFSYQDISLTVQPETVEIEVMVENSGARAGDEVVQLYLCSKAAPLPIWQLRGFTRLPFAVGERKKVHFTLTHDELADYALDGSQQVFPGEFLFSVGGCFCGQYPAPASSANQAYILGSFFYPG